MDLGRVILAQKSAIKVGSWRSGKVPRADFPLGRNAFRLGSSVQWCVVSFQVLGAEGRVLVVFNPGKEKFQAVLGVMGVGSVLHVLCDYQYHATEPGWHAHASCEPASRIPAGVLRGPWIKRIPAPRAWHRRADFALDGQEGALRFALDRYRIYEKGPLL